MKQRIKWWMKAILIVVSLISIWGYASRRSNFSIGPALPQGIVQPQIAIGWDSATLLAPDGSLWVWGYSGTMFRRGTYSKVPKQLGSETDWAQIVAGGWNNTFALKTNGTLWGWGGYEVESHGIGNPLIHFTQSAQPARIGIDSNWAQIRVVGGHALALKSDGSLWAWGDNNSGQLGDGTTNEYQPEIMRITRDQDWAAIAIGDSYGFALKKNGTIWGWGRNYFDREGYMDRRIELAPRQIDPGTNWVSLSVSYYGLVALKTDGTLWICDRENTKQRDYWSPKSTNNQTSIFIQFDPATDWQRISSFEGGLIAAKGDSSCWFFGGPADRLLNPHVNLQKDSHSLLRCEVEPWAFENRGTTSLLLAKDGTLWSLGERIGFDPTTLLTMGYFSSRLLGDFWPVNSTFKIKNFGCDQAPTKIWELPTQMKKSLGQPSKVDPKKAGEISR